MKRFNQILICASFCASLLLEAQERPPVQVYSPIEYGADNQNWSISQSPNRYIYIANNKGLLEYNGATWNLYESPNQTLIRAVKVIDSLIYTGCYREFGYWKKDNYGVLNYTSLSTQLGIDFLEDEEFWNIMYYDNWILFQSLNRIYIYNKVLGNYSVIDSKTYISRLFKSGESFYFQNLNDGLYKIENGNGVLISDDNVVKDNVIVNIFNFNEKTLVLTQDRGFFNLVNGNLISWKFLDTSLLDKISVFSAIQLQDKSFLLGTISDGIIHFTKEGELIYRIDQSNVLSNNTVLSLFEDLDNNIWLGLDNGINCVNIKSPYLIYHDKNGALGSVYTSKIYKGSLYLGTNQGLFYKELEGVEEFQFIKGTQGQVWFLETIDDSLFCGHNSGTFIINNKESRKIANVQGTWQVKGIENQKDLLIQGNYDGLYILEKKDGVWGLKNKLEGFNVSSRYFEFLNNEEVYLSHEYKGLIKLKLNKELTKIKEIVYDTFVDKGLYSSLIKYENNLLYTNKKGIFKYDVSEGRFQRDTLLSKLIEAEEYTSGKLVSDVSTGKLWSFSSKGLNYLETTKLSGEKKVNTVTFPFEIRKDVIGYESATHIAEEKFLLGSSTGYIILDLDKINSQDQTIDINQIRVGKLKHADSTRLVRLDQKGAFDNEYNNLRFSYSISKFLKTQKSEYQYKLEGMYDSWSDWTTSASVLFENLPYGDYTFRVNGRVGNQVTLNTASYSFKIKRPWFLSNPAIFIYISGALLFSLMMHNIYKRYYRKQRERLMLKTTREFELKELETKQELMRFKNDKLREDVESKNRELAISTMNLIKKNEFLGTIKKELESPDKTNLRHVLKIIDRNLNNSDDWNLFQEAFNSADKDFLKKIKALHPVLTSNDLRLCAYLRLNLSSKEIAPLLNISPRSVEVKRYRLRKKMDLSHEDSLTDYILEI